MDLAELRDEIAGLDRQIIELVSRRTAAAEEVGRIKRSQGLPIVNSAVEEKVIARYVGSSGSTGLSEELLEKLAKAFIQEAVEHELAIPSVKQSERKKVSVIGGGGKMGAWVARLLEGDGHTVAIIDPAVDNGLTIEDASESDVVVVSVPIHVTGPVLEELDKICRADALIFDLASLKTPFIGSLLDMAKRRRVCSIHPMFGPSARTMFDRNLIICDCGCSEAVDVVRSMFDDRGGHIRSMDVREHDEYMSYVLGLSHAVNIAFFTVLERSGITYDDMRSVASTTFRKSMETNESVALEDPSLYYEIQHANSSRDVMWEMFSGAVDDLRKASMSDDSSSFRALMEAGRRYFEK